MSAPAFDGWTPIQLTWVEQQLCVDWCRLGRNQFAEPFFDQTVAHALRDPARLLFRRLSLIRDLPTDAGELQAARLRGFVFHLSRSGSTLVAQMLASVPQNIVISEASPIDQLLHASWIDAQGGRELRIAWLRGLVRALSQGHGDGQRDCFIKFHTWHPLALPLIHDAFPEVPWIFLYRDPVEVLVSQQRLRGTELIPGILAPELLGLDLAKAAALPVAAYGACVLASVAKAALNHAALGRSRFVNFAELPSAVVDKLGKFFGVAWSAADRRRMEEVTGRHAKRPGQTHEADSEAKQRAATDEIRALAGEWFTDIYPRLEAQRQSQANIS